jgi:formamidopyrimidine-DNA glycosylase
VPELPEVETVRSELAPVLTGRRLEQVAIHDPRLVAPDDPRVVGADLEGERVASVERRGKYLIIRFESGRALVVHLRMTGSFRFAANGTAPETNLHTRAVVKLDNGVHVTYRDVRRFGTWRLLEREELDAHLAVRLGVEPLGPRFTAAWLAERLAKRRAPIKGALLDQRTAAGLGNIYVDEALWRARVSPLRPAGELEAPELRRLPRAIRDALRHGIARQGASLRDYRRPGGEQGKMQHEFHVYGRGGEPCDRCGMPIEKSRVAGRGTWFCPQCQPM